MTVTVGVDLAAAPARTAAARVEWDTADGCPRVESLIFPADDDAVVEACDGARKVGVDCPLGWPVSFVDFVTAHRAAAPVAPATTLENRRSLLYRATDLWCHEEPWRLRPLSVAADRIAHAAVRCAALLPRLDGNSDRSGAGRVVECYPAGALRVWECFRPRYKAAPDELRRSLSALEQALSLRYADDRIRDVVAAVDHCFDAVVTALVARAAELGRTAPPPPGLLDLARVEGWIALPTCSPEDLRSR